MFHHLELLLAIFTAQYVLLILAGLALAFAIGFVVWARGLRRRFAILESSGDFEGVAFQLAHTGDALEMLSTSEERIGDLLSSNLMRQPLDRRATR